MSSAYQCQCGKRLVKKYIALGKCAVCAKCDDDLELQPDVPEKLQAIIIAVQEAKEVGYSRTKIAELIDELYGITKYNKPSIITPIKRANNKEYHKFSNNIESINKIPKHPMIDIKLAGYSAICYYATKIKRATEVKVKQYDLIPIPDQNRRAVIKIKDPQFKEVSVENYVPMVGYMNVSDKFYSNSDTMTQSMLKKIIIDNNLNFKYGKPDLIFYDIETYNIKEWNKVPDANDANAKIGLISLVHISNLNSDSHTINVKLFHLNYYLIKRDIVKEQLSGCNITNIEYIECSDEYSLAYEFFRTLGNLKAVTLVAGFNSSASKREDDILPGYDLGFLSKRCQAKLTMHKHRVKFGQAYGTQFTTINELHYVYFIDMQVLLCNGLMPAQRNAMESFKLDEYLKLYKVPQKHKITSYRQLQESLATKEDISIIAAYCIYDSYALYLVNTKSMAIERLLNLGETLNVPLSYILYNTQASNLGFQLMRKYVHAGFCIPYKQICEKVPYQGAYTFLNEDEKLKVIRDCSSFDFTSLYPSIIRINNLSSDTLLNDDYEGDDCKIVSVIDDYVTNGVLKTYKFSKTIGIIPQYLAQLFEQRMDYKNNLQKAIAIKDEANIIKYDILQYNTKICLNTLYGLVASNFTLMQPEVSICCTAIGRMAIKKTSDIFNGLTGRIPIMCDTDSIYGKFDNEDQLKTFPSLVRDALGDSLYNLEYEGTYEMFMMSKAKKSYVKLHNGALTIKGLAWSKYTSEAREWVKQMFHDILLSGDIMKVLHTFYHHHKRQIIEAIEAQSISRLRAYTRIVKLSGKSNEVKYLLENYPSKEDIAYVVEICATRKNQPKAELIRPIGDPELDFTTINIQALMQWLMAGATKLIMPIKLSPIETDDLDLVYYRTEKLIGNFVQDSRESEPVSVEVYSKILRDIEGTNMAIHEVFKGNRKYRVFLDVDYTNKNEAKLVIAYMTELLAARLKCKSKAIKSVRTSNQDKSFHIFFNVRGTLEQIKALAEKCHKIYPSVDTALYAINKSVRSPLCPKIDRHNNTIDKTSVHYPSSTTSLNACIVHNIMNTHDLTEQVQDISTTIIDTKMAYRMSNIPPDILMIINSMLYELGITYDEYWHKNNIWSVRPKDPFNCPACNIKHYNHNPYIICTPTKLILKCSAHKTMKEMEIQKMSSIDCLQSFIDNTKQPATDYRALNTIYFEYDLPSTTLVTINSSVGTGKSVWLKKQLAMMPKEYTIICLSFRRSFTRTFCESYGLESYLDMEGKIMLDVHPKIMIQCDSLHRLELNKKIDVLILDEVVSILSQFNSSMIKNTYNIYQIMHSMLMNASKIIAMDALLYPEISSTLSCICSCQNDAEHIVNTYKPYAADVPFKLGHREKIITATYNRIKELDLNAKVAAFISSYKAIKTIYINLVKDGRKVLMLHGKDLVFDQSLPDDSNKLVPMKELKMYWFEHLADIFNNYDVLLYTSTITAGLSIDKPEIDLMIGCYIANTCSPLDFVQGMFRVRKRKCTEIYYQMGNKQHQYADLIPAKKASKLRAYGLDITGPQELQIVSECLTAQLEHERDTLTIKFLTDAIGFRLKLEDINEKIYSAIETYGDTQLASLYLAKYIPSETDLKLYDKIQRSGGDYADLEVLDDKTYFKWQWISILKTYGIIKTPDQIFKLNIEEIKYLYNNKHIYTAQQYRIEKYELDGPTSYNEVKYKEITTSIVFTLNKLNVDNMLVKTDPRLQRHLKDQQGQELLSIIANKFKGDHSISNPELNAFLNGLDSKFGIYDKYPIRSANNIINSHGYSLKFDCKSKIDGKQVKIYKLAPTMTVQFS